MRITNKNEGLQEVSESSEMDSSLASDLLAPTFADHRSYHEMADKTLVETDALTQFHSNLKVLSDLTSRLQFLNREIRYMMKVD